LTFPSTICCAESRYGNTKNTIKAILLILLFAQWDYKVFLHNYSGVPYPELPPRDFRLHIKVVVAFLHK
jgi:hypothetical protein